jgi:hypothetical protein
VARAGWLAARRLVPLAVVAIASIVVVAMSICSTDVVAVPMVNYGGGPNDPVGEGFTWSDIEAIHDGAGDGSLLEGVLDNIGPWHNRRPDNSVVARFMAPSGIVTDTIGIGWPTAWVIRTTEIQYENAPLRDGIVPRAWAQSHRSLWNKRRFTFVPNTGVPPTPVKRRTFASLGAICLTIVMILLVMLAADVAGRLSRRRLTMRRRLLLLLAIVCLIGLASAVRIDSRTVISLGDLEANQNVLTQPRPPGVDLGLTLHEVAQSSNDQVMDEIIAGAIIAAIEPPGPDMILAVEPSWDTDPRATIGWAGWPLKFVDWNQHMAHRPLASFDGGQLQIGAPSNTNVGVDLESISSIVVGLVLLWWLVFGALWFGVWRRTRRRARRGLCVGCGYPRPLEAGGDVVSPATDVRRG